MKKKIANREKGTGTIEKKRNHFYLKLRIGQQCKTTLLLGPDDKPVTTRKDAEAAAARLRPVLRATQKEEIALHIANAKNLRKNTVLDIDHVWSCYLAQPQRPDSAPQTLASYKKSWDRFAKWLRENHIEIRHAGQIDDEIAVEYFDAAWGEHISPRTYNSFRQSLKLIFKHILPVIGLDQNPFNDIRRKSGISESRREFTEEQVNAIFQGFTKGFFYQSEQEVLGPGRERLRKTVTREYVPLYKDEMFVLLNLCCWTGCRGQDGCLMRWSNVNMEQGAITYVPRKTARKTNNRAVSLPLHPELAEALREAAAFRDRNRPHEDYIIPSVAERYKRNHSGVQGDVQKIIMCATGQDTTSSEDKGHRALRANLYSLHSFRHTFVSFCANAGVPLDVVGAIVGHGSIAMTRHYAHISDEAKEKAIKTCGGKRPTYKIVRDIVQEHSEKQKSRDVESAEPDPAQACDASTEESLSQPDIVTTDVTPTEQEEDIVEEMFKRTLVVKPETTTQEDILHKQAENLFNECTENKDKLSAPQKERIRKEILKRMGLYYDECMK